MTTKKDIVNHIATTLNLSREDTKAVVQMTLDTISDVLATKGRLELRDFGVFQIKERRARKARNPKTGEEVMVPPRKVITFKPGRLMEEKVRQPQAPPSFQAESLPPQADLPQAEPPQAEATSQEVC
jgi:nucleoid DNA-binding protein